MAHPDNRREKVEALLRLYSEGKTSSKEEQELFEVINLSEDEDLVRKQIENIVYEEKAEHNTPAVNWEMLYHKIEEKRRGIPPGIRVRKMFPVWWAAAAVVALLLGTGYYFWKIQKPTDQAELVKAELQNAVDIAPPASANAILTLANGQVVVIDSAGNGTIVQQGAVDIVKLTDGQIAYKGTGGDAGYNTLSNPRGSRVISLTLADGTRVWLNAASAITYPVAFNGKERKVKLDGEAYFEVAHNPAKPFIVSKGETEVRVLGTHFNVKAYDDESSLDVTLLEGSVSVATAENISRPKIIRPGEQAQVTQNGAITLSESIDLNEVMAWKENLFSFNGAGIESIMRQVSRWYDVEVVFRKPVTEKFYVEVSKNTNVSTLLKMLEATKAVHFTMEEGVIVVTP